MRNYIHWLNEIRLTDVSLVGGKNASLGELYQELVPQGVRVPNGFAITADAYRHFLGDTGLTARLDELFASLNVSDIENLRSRGSQARQWILAESLPMDLQSEILSAYEELSAPHGAPLDVAVRSSATAEDLPEASFAGQQETYLNVQGYGPLLESCKRCFASLFTDRAISYRANLGFDFRKIALSIGVQQMVRSDLASSGVLFSLDTETGFRDVVLINSSYGLGENIVQGAVTPDEIYVFKTTLKQGYRPVIQRKIGTKEFKLIYDVGGAKMVKNVPVPQDDRSRLSITDDEALTLARWACLIEDHFSERSGRATPVDIEWAKDGRTGELFIVQARPETVHSRKPVQEAVEIFELHERGVPLVSGRSVGDKIASGLARVIRKVQDLHLLQNGEILVTDKTDPDWEPVMKRAAAVITNRGGRTCHAAIVSRELGLPAIVGAERATELLRDGQRVTVSCAEGETGFIYDGQLPFQVRRVPIRALRRPTTKVMMNLANPEEALRLSQIPNDGVGLARMEFIISNVIRVHPLALARFDSVQDLTARSQIEELTRSFRSKSEYFVERLAESVGMIAAAFYPKDVIIRLSDFKTNEYATLLGGKDFEPAEENPMLGFRGASRYYHPRYREGFALECQALKRVRGDMGLTNLKVMVPFCRTPEEGAKVIKEMERHGLCRGENGLEVYVMCEIPSNVLLAKELCMIFDGFSIGSNDLTQLILGVDRDSEIVAPLFDERSPAVKAMISKVISVARSEGRKIGICGQAPSDYPDFAAFLVQEGIGSISLNPDAVLKTTVRISEEESRVRKQTA